MNILLVAFLFGSLNVVFVQSKVESEYPRSYEVTIYLNGTKFDSVDGKFIFDLIVGDKKFQVPLDTANIKLEYNKEYSYMFAAPYDISEIKELAFGWERKLSIGSLFTNKKIYVSSVVLDPAYMPNPYIRHNNKRKYCPLKADKGIKSKEVITLTQC